MHRSAVFSTENELLHDILLDLNQLLPRRAALLSVLLDPVQMLAVLNMPELVLNRRQLVERMFFGVIGHSDAIIVVDERITNDLVIRRVIWISDQLMIRIIKNSI